MPVFASPAEPASVAETVPDWPSNVPDVFTVNVPDWIRPPAIFRFPVRAGMLRPPKSSVPEFTTTELVATPKAFVLPTSSMPLLIVVMPVWELLPESVSRPVPSYWRDVAKVPVGTMFPARIVVPEPPRPNVDAASATTATRPSIRSVPEVRLFCSVRVFDAGRETVIVPESVMPLLPETIVSPFWLPSVTGTLSEFVPVRSVSAISSVVVAPALCPKYSRAFVPSASGWAMTRFPWFTFRPPLPVAANVEPAGPFRRKVPAPFFKNTLPAMFSSSAPTASVPLEIINALFPPPVNVPVVVRLFDPTNVKPLVAFWFQMLLTMESGEPATLSKLALADVNCSVPLPRAEALPMLIRVDAPANVLPA